MLNCQVRQGGMGQARVRLPAAHRLLRVEGEGIRTWEVKSDTQGQILDVEFLKGIASTCQLTIETEKVLNSLPLSVKAEVPHAMGVNRETGRVALRGDEELQLAEESTVELYRVDVEDFGRLTDQKPNGILKALRF